MNNKLYTQIHTTYRNMKTHPISFVAIYNQLYTMVMDCIPYIHTSIYIHTYFMVDFCCDIRHVTSFWDVTVCFSVLGIV